MQIKIKIKIKIDSNFHIILLIISLITLLILNRCVDIEWQPCWNQLDVSARVSKCTHVEMLLKIVTVSSWIAFAGCDFYLLATTLNLILLTTDASIINFFGNISFGVVILASVKCMVFLHVCCTSVGSVLKSCLECLDVRI